jgi:hypothetical protein
MQDRQMVFPKCMRKSSSPALTPRINRRVKIMTSHIAFLGMAILPEARLGCQPGERGSAAGRLATIISRGGGRGKNFSKFFL